MPNERLLLIDDDRELCTMLCKYLSQEGFDVRTEADGTEGLRRALSDAHDLVVLDVMLPGLNGFELLRRMRERSTTPVLMLTARDNDVDRVVGLELGADDYLPKPFSSRELVARIRAILRRIALERDHARSDASATACLVVGDLELEPGARLLRRSGVVIDVTTAEFDVLLVLLNAAGTIVRREQIARAAFRRPLSCLDRTVDMHISKLRRKLGSLPDGTPRIRTVRNVGYLYATPLHRTAEARTERDV